MRDARVVTDGRVVMDGRVLEISHVPLALSDGVVLSTRHWLPADLGAGRVPAIVEVIPYGLRTNTALRDSQSHRHLAARGFGCVRVDMRGCGSSTGSYREPTVAEARGDLADILAAIARLPWCDGAIGMMGLSTGAQNALLAAAAGLPELRAVVAIGIPLDQYRHSIIYKGGCLLTRAVGWSDTMLAYNAQPPDPAIHGPAWRDVWEERLSALRPMLLDFLAHPRDDAHWAARRVPDIERIRVPLLVAGGWADGEFANVVPHLLDRVAGPIRAIVGPWAHRYPHLGLPGPAIDFLAEAADWFDRWLRGRAPAPPQRQLIAWLGHDRPTTGFHDTTPGRWIAIDWPAAVHRRRLPLDRLTLTAPAGSDGAPVWRGHAAAGLAAGEIMPWFAAGPGDELPGDQAADDAGALCFETAPSADDTILLGMAEARLRLRVDRPIAQIVVRLCDVRPDGGVARVSFGLLNLCHAGGTPAQIVPDVPFDIVVPCNFTAYRFRRGHRIRLAVSGAYWPLVWPAPSPATLTLDPSASGLELPSPTGNSLEAPAPSFAGPAMAPGIAVAPLEPARRSRRIARHGDARMVVTIKDRNGTTRPEDGTTFGSATIERYAMDPGDPGSAGTACARHWMTARGGWLVRGRTRTTLRLSDGGFIVRVGLTTRLGEEKAVSRTWSAVLPRDLL